jgi:hypothetical protein
VIAEGHDAYDLRLGSRDGAGLIHGNGLETRRQFDKEASFDPDARVRLT